MWKRKRSKCHPQKFVIEKDGKKYEYSSVDEMPPDIRRFHEKVQASLRGEKTDLLKFGEDGLPFNENTVVFYNGTRYNSIEDVPDESFREHHRISMERIKALEQGKVVIDGGGKVHYWGNVWCPKCGSRARPKKTLFGKYICLACKFKWVPDKIE